MEILLIQPKGFDISYTMPLSLGYLKSNLDEEHNVEIIDCSLLNLDSNSPELKARLRLINPNVVGVSCWSITYKEGLRILKIAKKVNKKIITIMGGVHTTSYPNLVMENKFIDFAFRGECELSFPIFLKEIEKTKPNLSKVKGLVYRSNNKIIKNDVERERNLDKIKIPDYDFINLYNYRELGYRFYTDNKMNASVWFTRGCPYGCNFCSATIQHGKEVRKHSIKYIIDWVKYLYDEKGTRHINIIDDNFTFDIKYAKEFCKSIIKLKLKDLSFGIPSGIRIQRCDVELLRLMKKAGWEYICIAPESGSERILKKMNKNLDVDIIPQKVKEIKESGLKVHGLFMIGYPEETKEDIKKTIKLLRKCKFNFFYLSNFQPLVGTPIYNELVDKGEIENDFLPNVYSSGDREYTPKTLKNFNFSWLVLKEYFNLMITQPFNIPYIFKILPFRMIMRRIYTNMINI